MLSEDAPLVEGKTFTLTLGDVFIVSNIVWVALGAALILMYFRRRLKP